VISKYGDITRSKSERAALHHETFYPNSMDGMVVVTDPVNAYFTDEKYAFISVPIYTSDEKVSGILYASYAFPPFDEEETLLNDGSQLYIYNIAGEMLYGYRPEQMNENEYEELERLLSSIVLENGQYP